MCGIFGIVIRPEAEISPELVTSTIKNLYQLSESRGKESSGLHSYVASQSKAWTLKGSVNGVELSNSKEFDNIIVLYGDNISKIENATFELKNAGSSLGIRAHPWLKNNNLFEFGEAMLQPRYKVEWTKTVNYINNAIKKGYVLESQMYWTSAILRNMKHSDIILLNEKWYNHIQKCGIECQISFNFISQKFSSITLLPIDICK